MTDSFISNELTTNFTHCPGLNMKNGKWWVPHGKTASNTTYCNYCKRTMNISGCVEYIEGRKNKCNCDSFTLKKNIIKALFSVSMWNRNLETHYESEQTLDDAGNFIVKMPSNTYYAFLIDSDLPEDQFFTIDVTCNNKKVEIKSITGVSDLLYSGRVLVKGLTTDDDNKKFLFIDRGSLDDENWSLINSNSNNQIEININVYKQIVADYTNITGAYLGNYKYENNKYIAVSTTQEIYSGLRFTTNEYYNCDIANTPLDANLACARHYVKVTTSPITIKIKIVPSTSIEEVDNANIEILSKARKNYITQLREKIFRIEKMKKTMNDIINTQQLELTKYDHELLKASTEMSVHLDSLEIENKLESSTDKDKDKDKALNKSKDKQMQREREEMEIRRLSQNIDLDSVD